MFDFTTGAVIGFFMWPTLALYVWINLDNAARIIEEFERRM